MNATDDITTEESSAVTLDHVTRTYKRDEFEVRALDDVTLDIPRKSFVAIMGPSGSGKTTLLNLVTGIDHATDRKSTRLNSSHANISYAVFCLKKKKHNLDIDCLLFCVDLNQHI